MNELPKGYAQIRRIDLLRNRREAIAVNLLAFGVMLAMLALGFLICPPFTEFTIGAHTLVSIGLTIVGVIVYMAAHELVHGALMRTYSGVRPRYGCTGLYAYAGSDALFDRRQYLRIAFAPVVLLGVLLAAFTVAFYHTLFWYFYIVQIVNISGAAGDFYVGLQIGKAPRDVLIRDAGTHMTLYSAAGSASKR